jgi:hypothetical protein
MSHSHHWEALCGDTDNIAMRCIQKTCTAGKASAPVPFQSTKPNKTATTERCIALTYPHDSSVQTIALIASDSTHTPPRNFLYSAYPCLRDGCVNPVQIERIQEHSDGLEALINATTEQGSDITFFDPHYYLNKSRYKTGTTQNVIFAALAYQLQPATRQDIQITEGPLLEEHRQKILEDNPGADISKITSVSFSLKNACVLIPTESDGDYNFRGVPQYISQVQMDELTLLQIRLTILRGEESSFDILLYASQAALNGGDRPQIGQSIEGFFWLQGRLA